jgi:alpha-1,2-mannosyltransferase
VKPSTDPAVPPQARPGRRFWITAAVLAVVLGVVEMINAQRHGMIDLRVYRMGGTVLLHGESLYDAQLPDFGLPFTYPPFAAIAMIPLAVLPWIVARVVWTAISVLCLAQIWRVALYHEWPALRRWSRPRRAALLIGITVLSVPLEPVRETLLFAQINLVLTAMILTDLAGRPHNRWAGALVGVATALKLTPVLFMALLVVTRQWRLLRNAALGLAAAVAIGFAVVPNQSWEYWTRVVGDSGRIGDPEFTSNQSVMGFLARLLGSDSQALRPAWFVIASAIALLTLWIARRYWYAADRLAAVSVCALGALFASPVSWSHHWVWALPIGVAIVAVLYRRIGSWRWAATAGVLWFGVFELGPMWWVPNRNDQELHWTFWQSLPGNAYLIAGLAALAVLGWGSSAPRRTDADALQAANSSSSPPTV